MSDMFKNIGSFYLYDNQLKNDYLILHDRKEMLSPILTDEGFDFIKTGEYENSLNYHFRTALNEICNLPIDNKAEESIKIMEDCCKNNNNPLIKLIEPLLFIKISTTHLPNYNGYNIYYNETKNKIKLDDFELASSWNIGETQTSIYRLYEYCNTHLQKITI